MTRIDNRVGGVGTVGAVGRADSAAPTRAASGDSGSVVDDDTVTLGASVEDGVRATGGMVGGAVGASVGGAAGAMVDGTAGAVAGGAERSAPPAAGDADGDDSEQEGSSERSDRGDASPRLPHASRGAQ